MEDSPKKPEITKVVPPQQHRGVRKAPSYLQTYLPLAVGVIVLLAAAGSLGWWLLQNPAPLTSNMDSYPLSKAELDRLTQDTRPQTPLTPEERTALTGTTTSTTTDTSHALSQEELQALTRGKTKEK